MMILLKKWSQAYVETSLVAYTEKAKSNWNTFISFLSLILGLFH